jgi:hypothetical protein
MTGLDNVICMLPNYEYKKEGDRVVLLNGIYESKKWSTMYVVFKALFDSKTINLSVPISISLLIEDGDKVYIDQDYNIFGTTHYNCFVSESHKKRWRTAYSAYLTIVSIAVFIAILIVTSPSYKLLMELGFNIPSVLLFIVAAIITWKYFLILNIYKKRVAIMDKYR